MDKTKGKEGIRVRVEGSRVYVFSRSKRGLVDESYEFSFLVPDIHTP